MNGFRSIPPVFHTFFRQVSAYRIDPLRGTIWDPPLPGKDSLRNSSLKHGNRQTNKTGIQTMYHCHDVYCIICIHIYLCSIYRPGPSKKNVKLVPKLVSIHHPSGFELAPLGRSWDCIIAHDIIHNVHRSPCLILYHLSSSIHQRCHLLLGLDQRTKGFFSGTPERREPPQRENAYYPNRRKFRSLTSDNMQS